MGLQVESLSRGLSTPGRCSYCQKIMFFKAYRCKHCRYRCHKKCAGHNHSLRRSHSCHKSHSGEEHWTKVLQANEVNSNLLLFPCHGRRAVHPVPSYEGPPSSPRGFPIGATCSQTKDTEDTASTKDSNIFSSLYSRFVQWVASTRKDSSSSTGRRTPRDGRSRSGSINSNRSGNHGPPQDILHFLQAQLPGAEDIHRSRKVEDAATVNVKCCHPSISSEDSDLVFHHHRPSYSSTCSSLTATSTSTAPSESCHPASDFHVAWTESHLTNGTVSTGYLPSLTNSANRNCYGFTQGKYLLKPPHSNLTFTISCPLKTKRPSISVPEKERAEVLCATWPPTGRKTYTSQGDEADVDLPDTEEDLNESVFEDDDKEVRLREKASQLPEALRELSIPYGDLKFGECVRVGRRGEIHRGRWHGEVMIHTFCDLTEEERKTFWQELSQLSMVRHENIALFMGACVDLPRLAVVTSVRKGVSLYEQIHLKCEKISLHNRVHVVRQITQAMGYLHAKGVVMGKLNSKNIYLEPKVKLCLLDYGMPQKTHDRPDKGCITYGHLTYFAPEIMRQIRVVPPQLIFDAPSTQATDIYSFGTILYELISGHFPFHGEPVESIIWQVAKGYHQKVQDLKCNSALKQLIEQCWEHLPGDRPSFPVISSQLQQNNALQKKHSSSEPERLNRSGLGKNIFT